MITIRSVLNNALSQSLYSAFGKQYAVLPKYGLLLYARGVVNTIGELTVLKSSFPHGVHPTKQQVKASAFTGAGSATVTGLLATDVITSSGTAPTCTVNGTLTFSADCWDIYVHRAGELWAYWPGINIGGSLETDSSGNDHTLTGLTGTTIAQRTDGSGTDYVNNIGYSIADGYYAHADVEHTLTLPLGTIFVMGYNPEFVVTDMLNPNGSDMLNINATRTVAFGEIW